VRRIKGDKRSAGIGRRSGTALHDGASRQLLISNGVKSCAGFASLGSSRPTFSIWRPVQAQQVEIVALAAAIGGRKPPSGCVNSSDCGSQYVASAYCKALRRRGLVGSMGRRGDPYGRHKAQSFTSSPRRPRSMKTAFWFFSNIAIERRAGLAKAS
jgi:hypothetical protein